MPVVLAVNLRAVVMIDGVRLALVIGVGGPARYGPESTQRVTGPLPARCSSWVPALCR